MRRLLIAALVLLWPLGASAQLPPSNGIVINQTPVQGGTVSTCLYITSARKVGSQACGTGTATNIQVATTTVGGGTSGRVLYDNAGILGEMTNTGSGTVNVLQASPTLITPVLGIATGTSLALGGATLGANALAVTGVSTLAGDLLFSADSTYDIGKENATRPRNIWSSGSVTGGGSAYLGLYLKLVLQAPSDGVITLSNWNANGFGRLNFGPATALFPSWKRSGTSLSARLADDSGDSPITASAATLTALTNVATTSAVCYNTGTGLLTYNSTIGTCTVSSLRYKTPIGVLPDQQAIDRVRSLRTESWEYKKGISGLDPRPRIGLYAEDVAKMDERCAIFNSEGVVENYDDRCVLAYLVAAVKFLAPLQ